MRKDWLGKDGRLRCERDEYIRKRGFTEKGRQTKISRYRKETRKTLREKSEQ